MKKAIVIIARNEGDWTKKTVNNLSSYFEDCRIIGVDDGGVNVWPKNVDVYKTKGGIGVGNCRRLGVEKADADVVLISDGHVYYDAGDIDKAWALAYDGNIVNSSTKSITTGKVHGSGRVHLLPSHKCQNIRAKEGDEVGMIGGVYFMRKDVALEIIAPTPSHGYNEQIMTCAAFSLGHKIYCLPSFCFAHYYKKSFNYEITYSHQNRNRELLKWWFFKGVKPPGVSEREQDYYDFIQQNRKVSSLGLQKKILDMNKKLRAQ